VKQLEHEVSGTELAQRYHGGVSEAVISLARHAGEIGVGNAAGDERAQNLDGDLRIGPAGESRDLADGEFRPGFRHIKPAVAGEPRKDRVDEAERRSLATSRDVTHGSDPQ